MKKRIVNRTSLLIGMLIMMLLVWGCGTAPVAETSDAKGSGDKEEPKVLALGTHGVGSVVNTMGAGIATVLSKGMSIEMKTVASSGPTEWLPMILTKEMDLGVLNNWDAQMGWLGKSTYEPISGGKGFPIMLITSGHKSYSGIVVADNSGIKTGNDLKGKRIAGIYTGSPGTTALAEAAFANLGITDKDVKVVSFPGVDAGMRGVIEGRVDANATTSLGMGIVSELDSSKGARFLSFDPSPEAIKSLQEKFPAKVDKVSPGNGNAGIKEDTYLMSYDFYLVGRDGLSEQTVYHIVKTLWEKNQELTVINKNLEDWTPENFVTVENTIPYHPGAIKFYKEKSVWTDAMEKRQQELLAQKK